MIENALNPFLIITISTIAPIALMFYYIYRKDQSQPEPHKWLWIAGFTGVIAALISWGTCELLHTDRWFSVWNNSQTEIVLKTFFCKAFFSELIKVLFLYFLIKINPYFDEHFDGIIYATCVGLGFASIDNILLYSQQIPYTPLEITHGMFSVLGHFFFAIVMGYYISLAHFNNSTKEKVLYISIAFLIPVILHGTFYSLLDTIYVNDALSIISLVAFMIFVHKLQEKGREKIRTTLMIDENEPIHIKEDLKHIDRDKHPFAFISYSRTDLKIASYILNRLEEYVYPSQLVAPQNCPIDPTRVRPVYLDITNLSTQTRDFSDELKENIAKSKHLILLCSPSSAKSDYVRQEIDYFLETHNNNLDLILPVYVDKVFSGMHPMVDTILSHRNVPIYLSGSGQAGITGRDYCFFHILEFLLKVEFDKLYNRYEEYKRHKHNVRLGFLIVFIVGVISALSYGWIQQIQRTNTEHDLAQFEKETFPYSLVIIYTDNFLLPTLHALQDSLNPKKPHIIVMMPNSYLHLNEEARKEHYIKAKDTMNIQYGLTKFIPENIKLKIRKRPAPIGRMYFSKINTPVYYDFATNVKAIKSVVDYKFDVSRHEVQIDTLSMSRDDMVKEYSYKFVDQTKQILDKDSVYVHFVFSSSELLKALKIIKDGEQ